MTSSQRPQKTASQTTPSSKQQSALSAPLLIFMTALDTTWRAFVPTLASVFIGIGLDHLLHSAPWATIICLLLGVLTSALLVAKQLRDVRKAGSR